jgi:hypothetical protein
MIFAAIQVSKSEFAQYIIRTIVILVKLWTARAGRVGAQEERSPCGLGPDLPCFLVNVPKT